MSDTNVTASFMLTLLMLKPEYSYEINSLACGRCGSNLKLVILKLISMIDIPSISFEITLR